MLPSAPAVADPMLMVVVDPAAPPLPISTDLPLPDGVAAPASTTSAAPVTAVTRSASWNVVPSPLTLTVSASDPSVPISARPAPPVCNSTEALSPDVALLIFT